jgi:cytochrome P450 family 710 subfamily A protein
MPPRDKGLPAEPPSNSTAVVESSASENASSKSTWNNASSSATTTTTGLVVRDHNTPSNTGWRRKTFHWELNLWTGAFLWVVYQYWIPVSWRFGMQLLGGLVACDAAWYYYQKGDFPGVPYTFPLVSLVAMIVHPVRFWAELATIAMESGQGICTNTLCGSFMLFVTDTALCRQVMTGERAFGIFAHPNALWLFGPRNLIYMDTEPHKQFRALLSPALFGKEALVQYAACQEQVCRHYMNQFVQQCCGNNTNKPEPINVRVAFRTMAAASSQEAFLGPYLTDQDRELLERDIVTFTMGFLSFHFPYLGF